MPSRTLATTLTAAAFIVLLGAQRARAGGSAGSCDVVCQFEQLLQEIGSSVDGGGQSNPVYGTAPRPAPAPLLAAGIPAFVALGGGAAILRLRRKFRRGN